MKLKCCESGESKVVFILVECLCFCMFFNYIVVTLFGENVLGKIVNKK